MYPNHRFPLGIPYPINPYPRYYKCMTANTNFCERDHEFSPYIAELINTLSNLIYVIYAFHGLCQLRARRRLTFSTALPHLGLLAVGLGSASYHATIMKWPQIADEIGMAIPTGAVLARLLSFDIEDALKRTRVYTATILAVTAVYIVHCISFTNWIHYPAFGAMCLIIGGRCRRLMHRISDPSIRQKVRNQLRIGRVLFVGAFGLWLVDRGFCWELTQMRISIGLPWGWLLELHGWWHIGTGMGAFVFIQVAEFLVEGATEDPGDRLSPFALRLWGKKGDQHQRNMKVNQKGDKIAWKM